MKRRTPLKRSTTPLRRTPLKPSSGSLRRGVPSSSQEEKRDMRAFFLQIWDERQDEQGYCYCFETGTPMHRSRYRELSTVYDHVLEKHHWSEYAFCPKNIIIILPEVHFQKGDNMDFTPNVKTYRNELINLHNHNQLDPND
jgi:hypothetical protein